MLNTSSNYSSLSRSHTPSTLNSMNSSINKCQSSPKCFGKNTHILKEEHERERLRWQQRLEESEQKLTEASINNSELFQIKAQLNRKIIELESNSRPLIEQNRRLNDRIRLLSGETKKAEEKLCYAQDDFLSLRDAYDRLVKDNSLLREQRATPEKLEELQRYRQQVLDYSKCLTALKQSSLEKDQRLDLLLKRYNKIRKCLLAQKKSSTTTSCENEEDRQSSIGSEGDSSAMGLLESIAEDLDEDVDLPSELLRFPLTPTEYSLKQQLELANGTIVELQNTIEMSSMEMSRRVDSAVERLQAEVQELQGRRRCLEKELANAQHQSELLEFQLVEMTEGSQKRNVEFADKLCSTNVEISCRLDDEEEADGDDEELQMEMGIKGAEGMSPEQITAARTSLCTLMANKALMSGGDRRSVANGIKAIDSLHQQLTAAEAELNMSTCELNRQRRQYEDELAEAGRRMEEANTSRKALKKKELQAEIDNLKKKRKEEAKKTAKQIQDLNSAITDKRREVQEKIDQISEIRLSQTEMDGLRSKLQEAERSVASNAVDALNAKQKVEEQEAEMDTLNEALHAAQRKHDEEVKQLGASLASLRQELSVASDKLTSTVAEMAHLDGKRREAEVACEGARAEVERLSAQSEKEAMERAGCEGRLGALEAERERLMKELEAGRAEISTLKGQIRPIGTQLEIRFEEARHRLTQSLKKTYLLEGQLDEAHKRIGELEAGGGDGVAHQKVQQLEAYNHELEEQFNAQMEIIAALKKRCMVVGGNAHSADSIGWTSNGSSSDGVNSLDDEPYHSEGSNDGAAVKGGKPTVAAKPTTTAL